MRPPQITGENTATTGAAVAWWPSFNEAPADHGGKLGEPGNYAVVRRSFNEAPADHGGKRPELSPPPCPPDPASMRPPQITGENSAWTNFAHKRGTCFNEAPADHGGKRRASCSGRTQGGWSFNEAPADHGGKLVDRLASARGDAASMRPPQITGENSTCWKRPHKRPVGRECERLRFVR